MKIGRNDPCPCGSGQKYKGCCGVDKGPSPLPGPTDRVAIAARFEEYQALIPTIKLHYEHIVKFEKEGRELRRAAMAFEKAYAPGTEEGVPDSMYLPWLYFDLPLGGSGKTVCGHFLESRFIRDVAEPGPALLGQMADSYAAFYEVKEVRADRIIFTELGTSEEWAVHRLNEPFEAEMRPLDLWYVRFVGPRDGAYIFSAPYLLDPESKSFFEGVLRAQMEEFEKEAPDGDREKTFRQTSKAFLPFWAEYFTYGDEEEEFPILYNTDGDIIQFCVLTFEILDRGKVLERLSAVKDFEANDRKGSWTWLKKGRGGKGGFDTATLGTVTVKRKYLTAETNSEERAARLFRKLKKLLGDGAAYKKMTVTDPADMPMPSPEEMKKLEEEQARLYADPEVRALLTRKAEDYYHHEWLASPIPALQNLTPLEAVATEAGKARVEELLDRLEERQDAMPDEPYRVEVDGLRKKLGLPPRKQGKR